MPYIYENDVGRLGGNLQTTVAYLLSLHKNEYEWNLLGIKVVGHVDALPIPDGTYEYGDAYTVGTAAPYDMWIYTRADKFHSEAYWFNIGKFPAPGPQGPKGDGLEQINELDDGTIKSFTYYGERGSSFNSDASVSYKDSITGENKTQHFTMYSKLPIISGKYISMGPKDRKLEVKVDDTALALDYYKINKTSTASVPAYSPTAGRTDVKYSFQETGDSLVKRGSNGEARFNWILANNWRKEGSSDSLEFNDVVRQLIYGRLVVNKTVSDTGTLSFVELGALQRLPQYQIQYDDKTYYRMDPMYAPNRYLNYIHLDSIEDGNGGYKATGKCFRITVSTRAWKVFDLDFGGSTPSQATEIYRHGITMNDANIVVKLDIYDNNSQNYTYEQLKAKLALNPAYCANVRIKRSDSTYYNSPATIKYWNDSTGDFALTYNNTEGNNINVNWTPSVVADNGTQIL